MTLRNKPKIILYYPKPLPSFRPTVIAPLPLIAISCFLAKEEFEIIIVSDSLYDNPVEKVLGNASTALCLGITAITGYQIVDGLRMAKLIKEKHPHLPIIWGGWHPTLDPVGSINFPYVDIVIRGQGERTLTELIHALVNDGTLDSILGLSFKKNGEIFHNMDRPLEDMNNFPSYPYHLIDVRKVLYKNEYGERTLSYVSSYGCTWDCDFCAEIQVHKRRWVGLNAYRMVEEIEKLIKDHQIDTLWFVDSEFFISKERIRLFCEEILRRGLKINWSNPNGRIPQLLYWEEDLWELIVRSGCKGILVGAESGYQPALDFMNKHMLVEETLSFAEKAKKYDLKIYYSFLTGLPWDKDYKKTQCITDIDIENTIDLVDKLIKINNRNRIMFFLYTPYPGSNLYNRSLEIGLKVPTDLAGWGKWTLNFKTTPWITQAQKRKVDMLNNYMFFILDPDTKEGISFNFRNTVAHFIFKNIFRFFDLIVKIRWHYHFFSLPLDFLFYRLGSKILDLARKLK